MGDPRLVVWTGKDDLPHMNKRKADDAAEDRGRLKVSVQLDTPIRKGLAWTILLTFLAAVASLIAEMLN